MYAMVNASKKTMKCWILIFTIFLFSLLSILISLIRGGYVSISVLSNIQISSLAAFFIYYITTYLIIKRNERINSMYLLLAMLIGASLLQLPHRILDFDSTISTLLDYLISILGVVFGYVTFMIKRKRLLLIFISSFLGAWLSITGNDLWNNILSYDSVTGKVNDDTLYNIDFQDTNGKNVSLDSLKKRLVLIDCWYTYCNECYKEMPKLQKIYDKYKDNSFVGLYALHCRIEREKEDFKTGKSILIVRGYDFPVLSIKISDSILKEMNLKVFPTVFIFNESKLVFRGSIKNAEKYLDKVIFDD